eukprot:jgi/Undpi1/10631/HiC_scaffold_29.g13081.m1
MIPLLAAIVLAGAAGAGPILVSDACGDDTTMDSETGRCAVEEADRAMRAKKRPRELKVEAEGKLYSVPDKVEIFCPPSSTAIDLWWKNFCRKVMGWAGREPSKAKVSSSEARESSSESDGSEPARSRTPSNDTSSPAVEKDVRSAGEHSCQICFEHDHSTAMLPCGHGGVCWECGLQIYALTQECPMCRVRIEVRPRSFKARGLGMPPSSATAYMAALVFQDEGGA